MMEVESNYFGTKSNYYLPRHYMIALSRTGDTLHHVVAIYLTNAEPIGNEDRVTYRADVRLYVGNNPLSVSTNLTGVRFPNPDPPQGLRMLDGWSVVQCCGGKSLAVFAYDTPWQLPDRGLDKIYWQKQPGTLSDKIDVIWTDAGGRSHTVSGDLSQDIVINLSPSGVGLSPGKPAQATLPSLSLG